jgi:hypothetical protein
MDGNFKQVFDPRWNRNCNLIDRAKRICREDKTQKRNNQKQSWCLCRLWLRLAEANVRKLRDQSDGWSLAKADFHFHSPLHVGDGYLNRWPPNVSSPRVHKSAYSRVSQVTIIEASDRGRDGRLLASTQSQWCGAFLVYHGDHPTRTLQIQLLSWAELEAVNAGLQE